jgi:hypothetical protein
VTTIAWDGVSLVGDRMRSFNNTPIDATKVFRLRETPELGNVPHAVAFGCAGHSPSAIALERWTRNTGLRPPLKDLDVMVVDAHGQCCVGDHDLEFTRVQFPFFAIGSGADYAMGAMARGATAREAVEIAMRFDTGSGIGVTEVRIK